MSEAILLERVAAHCRQPEDRCRLLGLAQTLRRCPSDRREAIFVASTVVFPELAPWRPDDAEAVIAKVSGFPHSPVEHQARVLLGQTPKEISGGLSRREAHQWLGRSPFISASEYLLAPLLVDEVPPQVSMPVARWLADVLRDPARREALMAWRSIEGPYGETVEGAFWDRVEELRATDLRPSVTSTFERAAKRRWKVVERRLAKLRDPLRAPPDWWLPTRCARVLLSPAELIVEGKQMAHCVGQYVPSVAEGKCVILALHVCGHRSTVELSPCGEVRQHRGPANAKPHDLCVRALEVLCRRWGIEGKRPS